MIEIPSYSSNEWELSSLENDDILMRAEEPIHFRGEATFMPNGEVITLGGSSISRWKTPLVD